MPHNKSSSTSSQLVVSSDSTSASAETLQSDVVSFPRRRARLNKEVENAIYSYIRAIRSLGRKGINTTEIAESLSLSVDAVNRAVESLKRKGVRVTDG
jgi:hypothetical protein